MSPKLALDYDWYKKSTIKKHNYNFIKFYQENRINLLNLNEKFYLNNFIIFKKARGVIKDITKVSKEINKLNFAEKLADKIIYFKINNILRKIVLKLNKIKKNSCTSKALKEFIDFKYSKLQYFKFFWGHCTNPIVIFKTK